eukprot:GGOE01005041.1.p1 GENE.GGOE01005041.1~~GGOE01005041.1.p1  ORF type:complete len:280 (-),score=51.84 GGOE01005041.1:538-1377(-)
MFQQGATYGSINSQFTHCEIQVADDIEGSVIWRRFQAFVSSPTWRLLTATLIFSFICASTLFVKWDATPTEHTAVSRAVLNGNQANSRVGCVVEIGASEGKVILYIPTAPWTIIVAQQEWELNFGTEQGLKRLAAAIHTCAKEARSYTHTMPFGSVKFVELQEEVKEKVARQIAGHFERNGISVSNRKDGTARLSGPQSSVASGASADDTDAATPLANFNLMSTEEAAYQRKHMARELKRLAKLKKANPALAKVPAITSSSPEPLPEEFLNHHEQVPRR